MKRQQDLTVGKSLSIWTGDIGDPVALDDYLNVSRIFEKDFGFLINDRAAPEVSEPDNVEHDISDLLKGFSFSDSWHDTAVNLCRQAGITKAMVAVVFFHLRYPPELCRNPKALLKFACNVPWGE